MDGVTDRVLSLHAFAYPEISSSSLICSPIFLWHDNVFLKRKIKKYI
jgi:hypothetical protein